MTGARVDSQIQIPLDEMRFTVSRSSGPGGQNVNKVNSKVTLHWNVRHSPSLPHDVRERFLVAYSHRLTNDGDVVIYSQKHRDQPQNRADCLEKLRQLILAVPPPETSSPHETEPRIERTAAA